MYTCTLSSIPTLEQLNHTGATADVTSLQADSKMTWIVKWKYSTNNKEVKSLALN